ncbi:sodium-dependent phosphate transport protein 2A-like isoform X2 [Symsagittifera roscoffensis]|uniref:sodium-dependent phosphate transport protein 2A-like isoform X2 n=1 Tax=Symsagittifera roscoffensis TaxID=84072 RepID=UPI00307C0F90
MTSSEHADSSIKDLDLESSKPGKKTRVWQGVRIALQLCAIFVLLYFFVCSVDLMSNGLKLIMGSSANSVFESDIMRNPVAGLMIGVMGTVLLQSSSTSTAIIVTLVASKTLNVKQAIPMVMGANIGTSVTSTFVAMGQINVRKEFERAFAGATVHDMFNWLTVIVLLPVEICTGYLLWLSGLMVSNVKSDSSEESVDLPGLKTITKPLTDLIVIVSSNTSSRILKSDCGEKQHHEPCKALFNLLNWSDSASGASVLVLSIVCLCVCLVLLVKVLRLLFSHYISDIIKKTVNSQLPKPFGFLTGYVAAIIGALLTVVIQSSSIFTSTLTPLVGIGVLELETIFPLTLGSNLGTTGTGILAAFANENLNVSLQIALCHLLFNLSGFILWYPVPLLRKLPLWLARQLGRITADYRWFALVYLIGMFLIAPSFVFLLSWAGTLTLYCVGGPLVASIAVIIFVNIAQNSEKSKGYLPTFLKTWDFLPMWLRSLEPYDKMIKSIKHVLKKESNKESFMTSNFPAYDKTSCDENL